ncbi:DUF1624 domain-containing protein [Undibacterium sp. Ji49W]|uniref:DUF1624 domain-containing protein n=1 Tax=Undibacterium sp. Ji49W TaxID=3413040 RepID=UPI003BF35D83
MNKQSRLQAIDLLRGLVIVLMALDHTRDFFAPTAFDPLNLQLGYPALFWTRWITHLCAPIFVMLAGMSAFLRSQHRDKKDMSRYLLSRGALMILLEWTWVSFSWQFGFTTFILQVIWAIGVAMMALAGLIWLPRWALITCAVALILPHNLLDALHGKDSGLLFMAWHQGGYYPLWGDVGIYFAYPLMPWIGLMAGAYAMGPVMLWDAGRRQQFLFTAAIVLLLSFVILRSGNFYGDPDAWGVQGKNFLYDLMSFVKVHKYPPSLLYLCITLGIGLGALGLLERYVQRPWPTLMLFGKSPMFFYLVHIALIHALGWVYMQVRYGQQIDFRSKGVVIHDYQPSLLICYAAWIVVLVLMWGLTRWWNRNRQNTGTGRSAVSVH